MIVFRNQGDCLLTEKISAFMQARCRYAWSCNTFFRVFEPRKTHFSEFFKAKKHIFLKNNRTTAAKNSPEAG